MLLSLAPELIHSIIDEVDVESLLILRRTCNILGTLSFDRFADAYISHRACYIFSKERWALILNLIGFRRLAGRVGQISFTNHCLEFQGWQDEDRLNMVLNENTIGWKNLATLRQDEVYAAERGDVDAETRARGLGYSTFPSSALINRVFSTLMSQTPPVRVAFDFTKGPYGQLTSFGDDPSPLRKMVMPAPLVVKR